MLGLNPYVILGVLLALLGAAAGGYWRGYTAADRSAQIRTLEAIVRAEKAQAAELSRQASAAHQIAGEAAMRERESAALATELQGIVDEYARALAAAVQVDPAPAEPAAPAPVNGCVLRDLDIQWFDRLRHGGPAARPVAPIPPERPAELR